MATSLKGFCGPLQVFIVLAIISTIVYLINMFTNVDVKDRLDPGNYLFHSNAAQYGYMALVLKVIFYIFFGYLLQVLCENKLNKVAWIILFLPYVLIAFIIFYGMSMGALAVARGRTGLLVGSSGFKVGGQSKKPRWNPLEGSLGVIQQEKLTSCIKNETILCGERFNKKTTEYKDCVKEKTRNCQENIKLVK